MTSKSEVEPVECPFYQEKFFCGLQFEAHRSRYPQHFKVGYVEVARVDALPQPKMIIQKRKKEK